jgi:LmbE family N-acetylglucosaminyl deacetylase
LRRENKGKKQPTANLVILPIYESTDSIEHLDHRGCHQLVVNAFQFSSISDFVRHHTERGGKKQKTPPTAAPKTRNETKRNDAGIDPLSPAAAEFFFFFSLPRPSQPVAGDFVMRGTVVDPETRRRSSERDHIRSHRAAARASSRRHGTENRRDRGVQRGSHLPRKGSFSPAHHGTRPLTNAKRFLRYDEVLVLAEIKGGKRYGTPKVPVHRFLGFPIRVHRTNEYYRR